MAYSDPRVSVSVLSAGSPRLGDVKALWRGNSKTLGFFPDGAFAEFAADGRILIAEISDSFAGYLAFRTAGERGVIVHLCTTQATRGTGVARVLVEYLVSLTRDLGLRGIGLSCRADFDANNFWPKVGFSPIHEKAGRNKEGKLLTYWWRDHEQPDLFSALYSADAVPRVAAAIDANIFFDLTSEREQGEESRALLADWLQEELELCITDEIYHEILRGDDEELRRRNRERVSMCRVLRPQDEQLAVCRRKVASLLGIGATDDDMSDRAHLAKAAASSVRVFLTRDEELIDRAAEIYAELGVEVMRPVELVSRIDKVRHIARYQPSRLAGSNVELRRLRADEIDSLPEKLCRSHAGERLRDFRQHLREAVAYPDRKGAWVIVDGEEYLGLFAKEVGADRSWTITLLRFSSGPLRQTLIRHYALLMIQQALDEGLTWLRIDDSEIEADTKTILLGQSFFEVDGVLVRCVIRKIGPLKDALPVLANIPGAKPSETLHIKSVAEAALARPARIAAELERVFWPMKVSGGNIPTYVVPIHPHWAIHVVDPRLATQELFGADPLLALNREHVYYRAPQMCGLEAPARLLWYVTKDRHVHGSMMIRACSRLIEIDVGPPKVLFRRYQRLGVYTWQNVFDTAGRDIGAKVMALRFEDTELLKTPISWEMTRQLGIRANFQSPVRIDERVFFEIYRHGTEAPEPT